MKIMFYGDNIHSPTGYSRIAKEFIKRFKEKNPKDELFYIGGNYGSLPCDIQIQDEEWLREQGVDTSEVTDFLINLIKQGFKMDRKEFVLFLKEVEEEN